MKIVFLYNNREILFVDRAVYSLYCLLEGYVKHEWIQSKDLQYLMRIFTVVWMLSLLLLARGGDLQSTITCLNNYMSSLRDKMKPQLYQMFSNSYPNTLTTTVKQFDLTPGQEQTYIITGDIEAMWLRDSTNQFLPYIRIPMQCPNIRQLAKGLINTQADFIMIDPYTNAYKKFQDLNRERHFYLNDRTHTLIFGIPVDLCRRRQFATRSIWERKFQIDSLASFLRLAYEYQQKYKSIDFVNLRFIKALKRLLSVIDEQSKDLHYEVSNKKKFYTFYRDANQLRQGQIRPSFQTGMIKTGFRPSDDPNNQAYNIPGNAMMCTYLRLVAEKVLDKISDRSVFRSEGHVLSNLMKNNAKKIEQAIFKYGVVNINGKSIFAYEVNGNNQFKTFDDANLPSLLSLPYLKFIDKSDPLYRNTREYILSEANPYYFTAANVKGIGSSHTAARSIWPLALITQILTSDDADEIRNCLNSLQLHSKDNLMHESFSVDNPQINTRAWFAWANSFFGQMIITLATQRPDLLK